MNFHVMTLFPEMITQGLSASILGRAQEKGFIALNAVNIRDYTLDKHKRVDDYPYGGGAGMVMAAEPVVRCFRGVMEQIAKGNGGCPDTKEQKKCPRVIYLTPQGCTFTQAMAKELAQEEDLIFLCGHYEGVDERAIEMIVTDQVSIGDYVLTGGELPVMVMIDVIARLVPGVLNNKESAESETFQDYLLEYPQYTRPEVYEGLSVPEVLLSGHHAKIGEWRRQQSILRTKKVRPELLAQAVEKGCLNKKEMKFYREITGDGTKEK